jgi:Holliday junction resolvase RusA-like endonuclease
MSLHIVYPELPPTSNKLYFHGDRLTGTAREYAERFAHYVAKNYLHLINDLNPEGIYEISLDFYFPSVVNQSFKNPQVRGPKQAQDRYKKFDLSNRIKLLEDCVRDALGIDDSRTFEMHQRKLHDPLRPRVEIFINETKPEWYGVPSIEEAWALMSDRKAKKGTLMGRKTMG